MKSSVERVGEFFFTKNKSSTRAGGGFFVGKISADKKTPRQNFCRG